MPHGDSDSDISSISESSSESSFEISDDEYLLYDDDIDDIT